MDRQAFLRAEATLGTVWSKGASLAPFENFIIDDSKRIVLGQPQLGVERVNVTALLTDAQRQRLQPYEQQDVLSKRMWWPFSFVSSAGGRAVYTIARANSPQMAVIVVDQIDSRALSLFETHFGQLRVTTDGRLAVVEEGEFRGEDPPAAAASKYVFKTGRIARFELEDGRQAGQVVDPALSGRATHFASVCVGAADDPTVLGADSGLFIIDWRGTPRVRQAAAEFPSAAFAQCVLAAR